MLIAKKWHGKYGLAALLSFVTFVLYAHSWQNDFINLDDIKYVINNSHIRSFDVSLFRWAFLKFYACNWHPLTWISHALDYSLWGLNPFGHHLSNTILHALNTFVVVILSSRLLETWTGSNIINKPDVVSRRSLLIISGTTGALFGLHPLHVESVAWVAERKDVLCGLFFLLSVLAYINYAGDMREKQTGNEFKRLFYSKNYLFSLGLFVFALLAKPMAVTLPAVLLLLDWYPLRRIKCGKTFLSAFLEKVPFLILTIASIILTLLAQKAGGALRSTSFAPFATRLLVAVQSLTAYIGKMILPLNLIPYYQYPENVSLLSWKSLFAIFLVLSLTIISIINAKKNKLWLAVWGYFIITLIPVIGIIQVGSQAMADRYMYLPSLAPFLAFGLLAAWAAEKIDQRERSKLRIKFFVTAAFVLFICAMAFLTFRQIGRWKDSITLWSYAIEKEPERIPMAYAQRGRAYAKNGQFMAAIEDYNKVTSLDHNAADIFIDRAFTYLAIGQREKAVFDLTRACELGDDFGCKSLRYFVEHAP